MDPSTLIVTQALISSQDGVTLHPDLLLWQQQLSKRRRQWFSCRERSPLQWYASLQSSDATALLASRMSSIPDNCSQCWLVTPYHAKVMRDAVRIYPEGLFAYSAADAAWLCESINPHLEGEGMKLHHCGAALLLSCSTPLDAHPPTFATISGKMMPDRHPDGEDGGRLNRLLAEIQMLLHQLPGESRGAGDSITGIWLSSPVMWPEPVRDHGFAVATRNPALASVVDGRGAAIIISEAERLSELVRADADLPARVVLAGEGVAVVLQRSLLPKWGGKTWTPVSQKREQALDETVRGWL